MYLGGQSCFCDVVVLLHSCSPKYKKDYHMKAKYKQQSRRTTPWDNQQDVPPLEFFLKQKYQSNYAHKHLRVIESEESNFLNSFAIKECKRCTSTNFKKRGYSKSGIQRYFCQDCKRYFIVTTNTIFENHKISISEWIEFLLNTFNYQSFKAISLVNKNSIYTTKFWIYKLFLILSDYQEHITLQGTVYIDETYYAMAAKDRLTKDGKELRGLSVNQMCIGIGYDGTNVYVKFEGFGKPTMKTTLDTFQSHIELGSNLYHDKERSHRSLVQKLSLIDHCFDGNEIKKLSDKDNPLTPINRLCYLLQRFLNSHSGVNRDDIQGYLNLFCYMMNPPINRLEKVRNLINSAVYLTKTLNYRETFSKSTDE